MTARTPSDGNDQAAAARAAPTHPFWSLPHEVHWQILELLDPEALIRLAFADYGFLFSRGLLPALSESRISYLEARLQPSRHSLVSRLPHELMLQVLKHLGPRDMMGLVLANYHDLVRRGIAPRLTPETLRLLRSDVHR